MATKKFNIDEVIAGAKIVQRCGEPAKFVSYTPEAEEETVVWLDESDILQLGYSSGGYFSEDSEDFKEVISDRDLFIQVPDPPTPKKIVQLYKGEKTYNDDSVSVWEDTFWDSVESAKGQCPREIYREVTEVTPEFKKVPYVQ